MTRKKAFPGKYTIGKVLALIFAVTTLYWVFAFLFPTAVIWVGLLLDGALLVLALAVSIRFLSWSLVNMNNIASGMLVIRLGIVLAWSMTAIWAIERIPHELAMQQMYSFTNNLIRGFTLLLVCTAASMHIIAIDMIEGQALRRNVCWTLWAIVLGMAFIGTLHLLGYVR